MTHTTEAPTLSNLDLDRLRLIDRAGALLVSGDCLWASPRLALDSFVLIARDVRGGFQLSLGPAGRAALEAAAAEAREEA